MITLFSKLKNSLYVEKTFLMVLLIVLLPGYVLFAQEISTNAKELNKFARTHKNSDEKDRKKAFKAAEKNNWITFKVFENGKVMSLQSLDAAGHPLYLVTDNNSYAAATTRANKLYTNGGLGLSLSGSSNFLKDKI